jgi:rhodanese-related sulfurtransferase
MSQPIDTAGVRRLADEGAQLLEVLPAEAYLQEHLPGAISLPLADIDQAPSKLDTARPVITYCYDHECDLSSRAAARLDALGFAEVYDYVDSKVAWLGAGLPSEGLLGDDARAGSRAHADVPTVGLDGTLDEVASVIGDWEVVVVVDDEQIVLGVVRSEAASEGSKLTAGDVLQAAPPTVRPSIAITELARSMDEDGQRHVLVSTSLGRLVGLVRRDDLNGRSTT